MKIRNEIWVGALTIVSIVVFILGYSFLKGEALFKKTLNVTMGVDNVARLQVSDPILMNGYQIGSVANLRPQIEGEHNILIDLKLNKDVHIPTDSRFVIQSADLFGEKEIEVRPGKSKEFISPDRLIQGEIQEDMMAGLSEKIDPIADKASNLMSTLDSTISALNLGGKDGAKLDLAGTFDDLSGTLENLNRVTGKLDDLISNQSENLEEIIENASGLVARLNTGQLDSILNNISAFSDQLSEVDIAIVVSSLQETLESVNGVLADIRDSDGTLNKIIEDDGLYLEVDSAVSALGSLLEDLQANPKKYINISIFGGRKKNQDETSPKPISVRP